jgi:hypothetical protein
MGLKKQKCGDRLPVGDRILRSAALAFGSENARIELVTGGVLRSDPSDRFFGLTLFV